MIFACDVSKREVCEKGKMRNAKMKICALLNIMLFWHVNPEPIKNDVLEAFRDGRPNQQEITRLHYSHTTL